MNAVPLDGVYDHVDPIVISQAQTGQKEHIMNEQDRVVQAIANQSGLRPSQVRRAFTLDFFTFVINFLPLAASNTDTQNFITQADSGFAIVKTSFEVASNVNVFVANISDTPRYAPQVITLSDSGSGRDLSNSAVAIGTLFGPNAYPFVWPCPKILDPNSTFTARVQNLVATAFNIRLSFHGYKIFGDVSQFRALKG